MNPRCPACAGRVWEPEPFGHRFKCTACFSVSYIGDDGIPQLLARVESLEGVDDVKVTGYWERTHEAGGAGNRAICNLIHRGRAQNPETVS